MIVKSFVLISLPILSYACTDFSIASESKSGKDFAISAYTSPLINHVLALVFCFSFSIAASISPLAVVNRSLFSSISVYNIDLSKEDFAFPGVPLYWEYPFNVINNSSTVNNCLILYVLFD